ncbi:hypothetical protein C7460_1502 [Marinoscillum furvescens DSM 4134]|uniref:Uncharacterized protein n=1 Tax=Marinoscillum furvescens DSM 4134 TaxID=1122208 RepID=A0A3D9KWL0_MARFU|nr:hypothetical protein C7460_1502 [Marinoscillum furvescens DSM 4134]
MQLLLSRVEDRGDGTDPSADDFLNHNPIKSFHIDS